MRERARWKGPKMRSVGVRVERRAGVPDLQHQVVVCGVMVHGHIDAPAGMDVDLSMGNLGPRGRQGNAPLWSCIRPMRRGTSSRCQRPCLRAGSVPEWCAPGRGECPSSHDRAPSRHAFSPSYLRCMAKSADDDGCGRTFRQDFHKIRANRDRTAGRPRPGEVVGAPLALGAPADEPEGQPALVLQGQGGSGPEA